MVRTSATAGRSWQIKVQWDKQLQTVSFVSSSVHKYTKSWFTVLLLNGNEILISNFEKYWNGIAMHQCWTDVLLFCNLCLLTSLDTSALAPIHFFQRFYRRGRQCQCCTRGEWASRSILVLFLFHCSCEKLDYIPFLWLGEGEGPVDAMWRRQ